MTASNYFSNLFQVDNLRALIDMFILVFVYTPPTRKKNSILGFLVRYVGMVFLMAFCIVGIPDFLKKQGIEVKAVVFVSWIYLVIFLFFTVYPILFYHRRMRQKIVTILSLLAVEYAVTALNFSLGYMLDLVGLGEQHLNFLLIKLLLVLFVIFSLKFPLDSFPEILKGGVVLQSVNDGITVLVVGCTLYLNEISMFSNAHCNVIYLLLYVLVIAGMISLYIMCVENTMLQRERLEHQMDKALQQQIDLTRENLQEIRKIRHDMKNQYAYLLAMLRQGDYEKATDTLFEYSQQKLTADYYVDCGNMEVSAILTMESIKAHSYGIELKTIVVIPSTLPFKNSVLLSIISNLIDNALEAEIRYDLKEPVDVQIHLRQEYLYIAVFNQIPDSADRQGLLSLKSAKGDSPEHGLGTEIVKTLAERYHGYCVFDIQDGKFVAEVMLDMLYARNQETSLQGKGEKE